MRDQAVPDDGLKSFGMRRDPGFRDGRHDQHHIADVGRMAAIPSDDAKNFEASILSQLQRPHDVDANLLLLVAPANGKDEDGVLGRRVASLQPRGENRLPALVIGAGGQFGFFGSCSVVEDFSPRIVCDSTEA